MKISYVMHIIVIVHCISFFFCMNVDLKSESNFTSSLALPFFLENFDYCCFIGSLFRTVAVIFTSNYHWEYMYHLGIILISDRHFSMLPLSFMILSFKIKRLSMVVVISVCRFDVFYSNHST